MALQGPLALGFTASRSALGINPMVPNLMAVAKSSAGSHLVLSRKLLVIGPMTSLILRHGIGARATRLLLSRVSVQQTLVQNSYGTSVLRG